MVQRPADPFVRRRADDQELSRGTTCRPGWMRGQGMTSHARSNCSGGESTRIAAVIRRVWTSPWDVWARSSLIGIEWTRPLKYLSRRSPREPIFRRCGLTTSRSWHVEGTLTDYSTPHGGRSSMSAAPSLLGMTCSLMPDARTAPETRDSPRRWQAVWHRMPWLLVINMRIGWRSGILAISWSAPGNSIEPLDYGRPRSPREAPTPQQPIACR